MKNSHKSSRRRPQIFGERQPLLGRSEYLGKDLVKFFGFEGDLSNVKNEGVLYYIYIFLFIIFIK